ncbi:MAG: hypothetical protein LM590_14830 [Thermofilum sp.]|nr:hypothetical protein [Thermofilum sp.]
MSVSKVLICPRCKHCLAMEYDLRVKCAKFGWVKARLYCNGFEEGERGP